MYGCERKEIQEKKMKLIIQIPCYNEEETLELAYNDLPRHIDGIDIVRLVVGLACIA